MTLNEYQTWAQDVTVSAGRVWLSPQSDLVGLGLLGIELVITPLDSVCAGLLRLRGGNRIRDVSLSGQVVTAVPATALPLLGVTGDFFPAVGSSLVDRAISIPALGVKLVQLELAVSVGSYSITAVAGGR